MKLIHVKWLAILLLGAGALAGFFACFVKAETPKLVMLLLAVVLMVGGLGVKTFGFRCPTCGSRIGLRYNGALHMTHCPDCGADLQITE